MGGLGNTIERMKKMKHDFQFISKHSPSVRSAYANLQDIKEHNAERLMIRYYEYLFRIRKFLYDKYSMVVLENLEQFPLDTNDELTEYYTKIATVVDRYNAPIHGGFRYDRFYVQKIKPFFINNKIYYEVASNDKKRQERSNNALAFSLFTASQVLA